MAKSSQLTTSGNSTNLVKFEMYECWWVFSSTIWGVFYHIIFYHWSLFKLGVISVLGTFIEISTRSIFLCIAHSSKVFHSIIGKALYYTPPTPPLPMPSTTPGYITSHSERYYNYSFKWLFSFKYMYVYFLSRHCHLNIGCYYRS